MTDLIKFLRTSTSSAYNKTAADRIELLVKERDTARKYAGEVRIREKVADDARIEAEAKLTKAMEALRGILKGDDVYPWRIAREILVELEAKE
jgi:hypothetical protein